MKKENNKKIFHDVKNTVVSIKMGIDMLKTMSETESCNNKLISQIDQAIGKLNLKWEELKEAINS